MMTVCVATGSLQITTAAVYEVYEGAPYADRLPFGCPYRG
jgi:hypothetical protein